MGSDIHLINKFSARWGLVPVFRFHKLEELWDLIENEVYDVALGGLGIRRTKRVLWSEPYGSVRRAGVIIGQNKPYIKGYDDVRTIGLVAGSAAHEHANYNMRPESKIVEVDDLQRGVDRLLSGEIEMLGTGDVSARYLKAQWPMLEVVDLHGRGAEEPLALAVRNNAWLLHEVNQFILAAKDDNFQE